MKIITTILLVTFSFIFAFAQTPEQKTAQVTPAVQEAANLSTEVVKLFGQKKYAEALPLAQKVVTIRESELGKNHLSIAAAYRNLAYIHLQLGKRKEAEAAFEDAFDIYEKNQPLSTNDEKTFAELLEIVAINQAVGGDLNKGEKLLQRAVELREKINGREALETSESLLKLADLYQATVNYEKAAPPLLRAFDIKFQKLGSSSDETEETFHSLSCVLTRLGRKTELTEIENKLYPLKFQSSPPAFGRQIINGKALKLITPLYPAEAKEKRVTGQVEIRVLIDENGKVIRACGASGAKELIRASESAAYQSTFTPTILNGKPVRVSGIIVYKFSAH